MLRQKPPERRHHRWRDENKRAEPCNQGFRYPAVTGDRGREDDYADQPLRYSAWLCALERHMANTASRTLPAKFRAKEAA